MDRLIRPLALALLLQACVPPQWGANAILHPSRTPLRGRPVLPHEDVSFTGEGGVTLKGWLFKATKRKGTLIYLHGIGTNRQSGTALAARFMPQGWDVFLYDQRNSGESGGDTCTYGVLERKDVSHALDALHADTAVVMGSFMGASVALQAAAEEPRIRGVIAQSPFADLRLIAQDQTLFFVSEGRLAETAALVEKEGGFRIDDASVLKVATSIHVPVLLLHGKADRETPPEHSRRIFEALSQPKELFLVEGADHRTTLSGPAPWEVIDRWLAARAP